MPVPSISVSGSVRPLIIVVILGALIFGWLAWRAVSEPRQLSRAAQECRDRYAEAKTFRDTVAVDATYPKEYALETSSRIGPATCGRLRREGGLQ